MTQKVTVRDALPARVALRCAVFAERWFPDAYVFAVLGVVIVATFALALGAAPQNVAKAFGDGFWSLIPFTMQMSFVVIGGYVVATAPVISRGIDVLALVPRTGRGAVCYVALISMLTSLISWGLSLILCALLVRALGRREDLRMDYPAAGAAAYLGLGAVWALGLSSSAAQLQANPSSMPPGLLEISGVLPFSQTVFLWQSIVLTMCLIGVSLIVAYVTAPSGDTVRRPTGYIHESVEPNQTLPYLRRPAEYLEYSPILTVLLSLLAGGWLIQNISATGISGIANLNSYNLIFLSLGLLLHWRPRSFLNAVVRAVPSTAGILIQFPLYGSISCIITQVANPRGDTLASLISSAFVELATKETFPVVMGLYSALLGFFVPSGGGKWIIEAPYVLQAANRLDVHLGWAVQVYNAAEALPNLINPFWMLPLLGVLGLRARDIVGFTFLQLLVHVPLVLGLLWALGLTLDYVPPMAPS